MTPAQYQALVDDLTRHEGLRLKVYQDTEGQISIGFGRNLTANGISAAEAHVLLAHDIERAYHDAQTFAWFADLSAGRQRAVLNLLYNLGKPRFEGFVKLRGALSAGDYAAAAYELRHSLWASQVGTGRTNDLAELLEHG